MSGGVRKWWPLGWRGDNDKEEVWWCHLVVLACQLICALEKHTCPTTWRTRQLFHKKSHSKLGFRNPASKFGGKKNKEAKGEQIEDKTV